MPDEEYPVVCIEMTKRQYAFTLKKTNTKTVVDRPAYVNHLAKFMSKGVEIQEREYEETSGLHMHGILTLPTGYDLKYLRYRGWHLHLVEIYSKKLWLEYINKDKPNKQ